MGGIREVAKVACGLDVHRSEVVACLITSGTPADRTCAGPAVGPRSHRSGWERQPEAPAEVIGWMMVIDGTPQ